MHFSFPVSLRRRRVCFECGAFVRKVFAVLVACYRLLDLRKEEMKFVFKLLQDDPALADDFYHLAMIFAFLEASSDLACFFLLKKLTWFLRLWITL